MNKTLTGRGVLLWLIAFFGIIFATNAYFIMIAVKTFSGEDEQKPYLQGVEYNDTLARRAAQRRLGWRATMPQLVFPAGMCVSALRLPAPTAHRRQRRSLIGELRHPADEISRPGAGTQGDDAGPYQEELAERQRRILGCDRQ